MTHSKFNVELENLVDTRAGTTALDRVRWRLQAA